MNVRFSPRHFTLDPQSSTKTYTRAGAVIKLSGYKPVSSITTTELTYLRWPTFNCKYDARKQVSNVYTDNLRIKLIYV